MFSHVSSSRGISSPSMMSATAIPVMGELARTVMLVAGIRVPFDILSSGSFNLGMAAESTASTPYSSSSGREAASTRTSVSMRSRYRLPYFLTNGSGLMGLQSGETG